MLRRLIYRALAVLAFIAACALYTGVLCQMRWECSPSVCVMIGRGRDLSCL